MPWLIACRTPPGRPYPRADLASPSIGGAQGRPKEAQPELSPLEDARGRIPYGRDGGRRRETRQRQGTQGGLPRRSEVAVAARQQVPPGRADRWSGAVQKQLPALPASYAHYPHVIHPGHPGSGMPIRTQYQALAPLYYGRLQVRRRGAPRARPRLGCPIIRVVDSRLSVEATLTLNFAIQWE